MQNKITDSGAAYALGYPAGRNLFKIGGGAFTGRMAALVQTSADELRLFIADPPYSDWSRSLMVGGDCRNDAVDGVMDADGNIHVVYAEVSTGYLFYRCLSYIDGEWSVGGEQAIYSGGSCYSPSIVITDSGVLWVSCSVYSTPNKDVYVKSSSDAGVTWGTGPADAGTLLSAGDMSTYSRLLTREDAVYVVYTAGTGYIRFRTLESGASSWSDAETVATGTSIDSNFDVGIGPDGLLAVVYDDVGLKYREYDGSNWGVITVLDEVSASSPQLLFRGSVPVVVYLSPWLGSKSILKYVERSSGSFSPPSILDERARLFDSVLLFCSASGTYEDLTSAACASTTGDVFHSNTGCLLENAGDSVYVGMDHRFRYLSCHLFTPGSGGNLTYAYWDGDGWKSFVPESGSIGLESSANEIVLFEDYSDVPEDWQRNSVNGDTRFWIRIRVTDSFTAGPVGDYLAAVSELKMISFRR